MQRTINFITLIGRRFKLAKKRSNCSSYFPFLLTTTNTNGKQTNECGFSGQSMQTTTTKTSSSSSSSSSSSRSSTSATNTATTITAPIPKLLHAYLYTRMHYNKLRKTLHHWWQTYLLFKCSILVLPIYAFLVGIGIYCIVHNIDVTPPLKTLYQGVLLLLSAAVIFIFVLMLATFNGDNRPPPGEDEDGNGSDVGGNDDIASGDDFTLNTIHQNGEFSCVNLDDLVNISQNLPSSTSANMMMGPLRNHHHAHHSHQRRYQHRNHHQNSSSNTISNILTAIFGNYDVDSDDDEQVYNDDGDTNNGSTTIIPTIDELALINSLQQQQQQQSNTYLGGTSSHASHLYHHNHHNHNYPHDYPPHQQQSSSSQMVSLLPTPIMLNYAQSRLVDSLEAATDGLEYFLQQCDSFENGDLGLFLETVDDPHPHPHPHPHHPHHPHSQHYPVDHGCNGSSTTNYNWHTDNRREVAYQQHQISSNSSLSSPPPRYSSSLSLSTSTNSTTHYNTLSNESHQHPPPPPLPPSPPHYDECIINDDSTTITSNELHLDTSIHSVSNTSSMLQQPTSTIQKIICSNTNLPPSYEETMRQQKLD